MEFNDSIFYYVKIIDLKQKIQYNGIRIAKMKKLCIIWFKIKGRLKLTIEEKKFILSSNREKLKKYFLKNPQKLLKFLEEIRLENISEETADIIHILIFIIVGGEFYLKNNNFNEILCKLSKDKNHYQHENIALIFENLYSSKLINCVYDLAVMELDYMNFLI